VKPIGLLGKNMSEALFEKINNPKDDYPFIETMSRNLNYISHYHEAIEIICVKSGTISVFSGAKEILLKKDDICFFMPGEIHGFKSTESNHLYVIKLDINSYVEKIDLGKIHLTENRVTVENQFYSVFKSLIDEMITEHTEKKKGYEFAVRYCKNKIIAEILRNLEYDFVDTSKSIKLLTSVNNFLDAKYEQKIELDEVAAACHFSKFYFAHKLKKMTGMTFVQYLTAFRLEKAVLYLKNSDMTITEIAEVCGFGSLRSFNRTFVAAYKTTPTNFRKNK